MYIFCIFCVGEKCELTGAVKNGIEDTKRCKPVPATLPIRCVQEHQFGNGGSCAASNVCERAASPITT